MYVWEEVEDVLPRSPNADPISDSLIFRRSEVAHFCLKIKKSEERR